MTTKKKTPKVVEKVIDEVKKVGMSEEAKAFKAITDKYKAEKPEKYEVKKEYLEAHLKSL